MRDAFLLKQREVLIILWPLGLYMVTFFAPISSKAHNNIFYIAVLVPFLLWVKKNFFRELVSSRIGVVAICLTGYLVLRSLISTSFDVSEIFSHVRHLFSFLCFFYISVALFYNEKLANMLERVAVWGALWAAGSAIYFYSHHPFSGRMRFIGPVDHPILGASVYALFCLFLIFTTTSGIRKVALAAAPFLFSSVLFSQSRGPLLALLCSVLITSVVVGKRWLFGIIVFFSGGFWCSYYFGWIPFGRLFQVTSSYRLAIWKQVFSSSWSDGSWLFGHSLAAEHSVVVGKRIFQHAHSGYVGTFAQGGAVGLFLLIVLVVVVGIYIARTWGTSNDAMKLALWIFLLLIIFTDTATLIDGPGAMWFYFWLPVAYLAADEIRFREVAITCSNQMQSE